MRMIKIDKIMIFFLNISAVIHVNIMSCPTAALIGDYCFFFIKLIYLCLVPPLNKGQPDSLNWRKIY